MTYTPHLKDREYYENQYDSLIVTQCRITEKSFNSGLEKELSEMKEWESESVIRNNDACMRNLFLYFEKGELAIKRDERIREWIQRDKEMDDFYENTYPKREPLCIKCNGDMEIILKEPYFSYNKRERHRILFMFECKKCNLRRAFYNDWEEFRHEKQKCEKCKNTDIDSEIIHEEKEAIYRDICKSCWNIKEDRFERLIEKEDLNYVSDREKYVLTEKETDEYRESKRNLEDLSKLVNEIKEKHPDQESENPWKEMSPQKRILDVSDMKDLIIKALKKKKYKDISFSNPVVFRKWVNIELSVAGKWLDKKEFQELIQWSLENTNWKVIEKSILVNLGILQCKLEGE